MLIIVDIAQTRKNDASLVAVEVRFLFLQLYIGGSCTSNITSDKRLKGPGPGQGGDRAHPPIKCQCFMTGPRMESTREGNTCRVNN